MNKTLTFCLSLVATAAMSVSCFAQQPPANPLSVGEKVLYSMFSGNAIAGAEKMPEENYSFKPVPEVRSFGQLVGHIADANNRFCSVVLGDPPPASSVEKTKTTKADLVQALKDAVAYCNKAYDGMTDAKGAEIVKFFGRDVPKLTMLSLNTAHTDEHYGNMVTYLRIKGIVPPSSEPRQPAPAAKPAAEQKK
jgi:uncharacterized damage-inducible protein DinB